MSARPTITAELRAELFAALPARAQKRLESAPEMAEGWTWTEGEVLTDGEERVGLRPEGGQLRRMDQLSCTCLLGPRCLHVAAVASRLPDAQAAPEAPPEPAPAPKRPTSAAHRAAARSAQEAATDLLFCGLAAAGDVRADALERASADARAQGQHRLGAALAGLAARARDGDDSPRGLRAARRALREALRLAQALQGPEAEEEAWGSARRETTEIGSFRVYGVCSWPVLTDQGIAGVGTLLADARGRLFELHDTAPGGPERITSAWKGRAKLGEHTHEALCRAGLFLQGATSSADGRLGAGKDVRAVAAPGAAWDEDPLDPLWRAPADPRRGWIFRDSVIAGAEGAALVLADGVRLRPPSGDPDGPQLQNLRLLARCPGRAVRVVGRPVGPRVLEAVAISTPGLPPEWKDRANLGLERLTPLMLSPVAEAPRLALPQAPDPLEAAFRRLDRAALGGVGTLPADALGRVEAEARALEEAAMPHTAARLRGLAMAARTGDARPFAQAWLALAETLDAAQGVLDGAAWSTR